MEASMTATDVLTWLSPVFGAMSGISWVRAALVETPTNMSYWDGPPPEVVNRIRLQSKWNGIAAVLAAVAAFAQAGALFLAKISN